MIYGKICFSVSPDHKDQLYMRRFGVSLLIVTLTLVTLTAQSSSNGSRGAKPYTTWTAYQGGAHSSQYSALDQINKSNV